MLQNGVELYEFKPLQVEGEAGPRAGLFGSQSRASLHAKAYTIDRSILVIGSMNLDPRSAKLNTELALVIHDQSIAAKPPIVRSRHLAEGQLAGAAGSRR